MRFWLLVFVFAFRFFGLIFLPRLVQIYGEVAKQYFKLLLNVAVKTCGQLGLIPQFHQNRNVAVCYFFAQFQINVDWERFQIRASRYQIQIASIVCRAGYAAAISPNLHWCFLPMKKFAVRIACLYLLITYYCWLS